MAFRTFHFVSAALCALLVGKNMAQFITPPTDFLHATGNMNISVRYKEVPGSICETTPGIRTYAGYIDVDANTHMYFWLFEARHTDPSNAPLTIWIDGGPGTPADSALFSENGPCGINDKYEVYYNPYSWNNVSNVLYIDQPVNTGFSYSTTVNGYISGQGEIIGLPGDECPEWIEGRQHTCGTYAAQNSLATPNSTIGAEDTFWRTLQAFTGAFPQYSSHGLHFSSESYGGHYLPVFTSYILHQNTAIFNGSIPASAGAKHLDLRSFIVNNGWYDPAVHYEAYYNYTVDPGNPYGLKPYTDNQEKQLYNAFFGPGNCQDQLQQCQATGITAVCKDADDFCAKEVEYALDRVGISEFDIRESGSNPFPYTFYPTYLNRDDVLRAIGAEVNYTDNSIIVSDTFEDSGDDGRGLGELSRLTFLYDSGVYVVMPAGDADYNCNWLGQQVIANRSAPAPFRAAGFENLQTADGVTHGQVKQYSTFALVRIYESGHEVAFYQPLASLTILNRTINRQDVATGRVPVSPNSTYSSTGSLVSTYYEGGSTLVDHHISINSTYNITTNKPNSPRLGIPPSSGKRKRSAGRRRRGLLPKGRRGRRVVR